MAPVSNRQLRGHPKAPNGLEGGIPKNPGDPQVAATIGFLHAWRVTERARVDQLSPSITDDLTMAARYFESAHLLEPSNPIHHGFYAAFALADSTIHQNKKKETTAWFRAQEAMSAWPEFNKFTVAYLMNALPYDLKRSNHAIKLLEEVVEICIGSPRHNSAPAFAQQLNNILGPQNEQLTDRVRRACSNTEKAPYNVQGFLLNMADTYLRAGQLEQALSVYETLKMTTHFEDWPFKNQIEDRLKDPRSLIKQFQKTAPMTNPDVGMMFTAPYSCMACHQKRL